MSLNLTQPPQRAMGLGEIGTGNIIFKRKFRWTMEIQYCVSSQVPKTVAKEFVKMGNRPQLEIEETEINYLHGKMWIPGKATWQQMTVTYYDVAGKSSSPSIQINSLFGWIASVYDITDPVNLHMGSRLADYQGQGLILLYDGCGNALEGWLLNNVWPVTVNFGELDMASSDECTIELTMRFANVQYRSYCPTGTITKCPCTPCASL